MLHALACVAAAGCHPVALVAAFWLGPHHDVEANVVAYEPLPFVAIGALAVAAGVASLVGLAMQTRVRTVGPERVAWVLHLAHVPYLPLWLVARLSFDGLEGNIIGFLVFPGALLWCAIAVPLAMIMAILSLVWLHRRASRSVAAA